MPTLGRGVARSVVVALAAGEDACVRVPPAHVEAYLVELRALLGVDLPALGARGEEAQGEGVSESEVRRSIGGMPAGRFSEILGEGGAP